MNDLRPATRTWFEEQFGAPTEVQRRGWDALARGAHALLVAPTGSGKTLAAFLRAIDELAALPEDAPPGVRVVYVSPLKALVADIERNLRAPLAGIARTAARLGLPARVPRVDVRTGDTPQEERRRQARDPGEILVTTPESLYLVLGSKQRETLRAVETVIVDEVHAVCATKRGVHLALSLERLAALAHADPRRIGLSATVRPLEEVARYLGGDREVELVDASAPPALDLSIRVPVPDMERVPPPSPTAHDPAAQAPPDGDPTRPGTREGDGGSILGRLYSASHHTTASGGEERGLWPVLYPELLAGIRGHRSTIVFVNSRGLCERLTHALNELAGEELVLAHHGSVSHGERARIEDALKRGEVRGIVATSSLELGVDMGAVDQVILVESPGSVARGLQRVGRAGHGVGETSRGRVYPKFKHDLLECAVVARRMLRGEIEALRAPRNCLDVLSQQLVAMCVDAPRERGELLALCRRAHPYRELSDEAFGAVLEMLSGSYQRTELSDLRPRLRWDRTTDRLSARPGAAMVSRLNAGTIPDRGAFPVRLGAGGARLGELDEEMVFESRRGDVFLLGTTSWRIEEITRDEVVVSPAPGEPGRLPFWRGEGPGRPLELGRELGAFVREYGAADREAARERLAAELPLDELAARNLADHLADQLEHTGTLPTDRAVTVERFRDELGDWRVCLLSPFGRRVHTPWALALERRLSDRLGAPVSAMAADDGIVLRLDDGDELPAAEDLFPDPDELDELLTAHLGSSALFASLFRENAGRALLVTRRRPDQRKPLWAQRRKAQALLATVRRFPRFPIVLETYRQALQDVFDLEGLREVLAAVRDRRVRVDEVETQSASPFARGLVFAYVAAYLYEADAPVAERKAQALTLDRGLLRDLLGQEELRDLLDAGVVEAVEDELAGRSEERRARDRDELADLLGRLGDLSVPELRERAATPQEVEPWLEELRAERRAIEVRIAGEARWIAAEDAGLFREALGCRLPGGLPVAFLEAPEEPLVELVKRFARGRGPFVTRELADRHGLRPAQVTPVLRALEAGGTLVLGALRPGGAELEWCDAEVLRRIRRRTLARLRGEVAAVDAATFARFLPRWHGLATPGAGRATPAALEEAVQRLEALPLSWRALTGDVLPARVPGFRIDDLDLLAARGELVWIGRGALGPRDGRVLLLRRERAAELLDPVDPPELEDPLQRLLHEHLATRGASFLTELERVARAADGADARAVEAALWDLVWAGLVTNDTFGPLRSLGGRGRSGRGARAGRAGVLAGGRWSLVAELTDPALPATARALARARLLLERHGIASREAVAVEDLPGGWGPHYRVLRHLEEAGQVRRGWFVEGLSGAQFASPGAADRLREARAGGERRAAPEVRLLATLDPASAWGAHLAWPEPLEAGGPRPRRAAGARLVTVDGEPAVFLPAAGRRLTLFGDAARAAAALERLPELLEGTGLVTVESLDGVPAHASPHRQALERAGFVPDYKGFVLDRAARRPRTPRAGG